MSMLPYYFLFLIPAGGALIPGQYTDGVKRAFWCSAGALFIMLIGFRHQVGGDWGSYLSHYACTVDASFVFALVTNDPAYGALNWAMAHLGWGVYGVNVVCALIFVAGLWRFLRLQPLPWLGLIAATPYLVIVVSMGYTRQAVAIGFGLWALAVLQQARFRRFFFYVALGALFHKSAVILFPFGFVMGDRRTRIRDGIFWGGLALGIGVILLQEKFDSMWTQYVEQQMESTGALVRVAMNALAGVVVLLWGRALRIPDSVRPVYKAMALICIVSLPLTLVISTAVDRVALYMIPLQILVAARFPLAFRHNEVQYMAYVSIVFSYAAVLWVWLNHASHAPAWLPYQNILFV